MNTREWFDNLYNRFKDTPEYKRECYIFAREEKIAILKEKIKQIIRKSIIIKLFLALSLVATFVDFTPDPLRFVTGGVAFVLMLILGCGWRNNCF